MSTRHPHLPTCAALRDIPTAHPTTPPSHPSLISVPAPSGKHAARSAQQTTTLTNGLRVVTQDTGAGVASVALHVKAGSRYEATPGTAFVLEGTAYNATQKRSAIKFQRDVEDLGATVGSSAGRETFVYSGECDVCMRLNGGPIAQSTAAKRTVTLTLSHTRSFTHTQASHCGSTRAR